MYIYNNRDIDYRNDKKNQQFYTIINLVHMTPIGMKASHLAQLAIPRDSDDMSKQCIG